MLMASGRHRARGEKMKSVSTTAAMHGKTVVITGASAGIGAAAARQLKAMGATVVPVGRSAEKMAAVGRGLGVEPLLADFSRLDEVRRLAGAILERCPRVDVLVNNAGGILWERRETRDGHETQFQVNHLAPFLLTHLLRQRLVASAPARIVTTSSTAHRRGRIDLEDLDSRKRYSPWAAYSMTKLANMLFTRELARRLAGTGVTATCFHPGVIASDFGRGHWFAELLWKTPLPRFLKTPEQGAETLVFLASSPDVAGRSGGYYADRRTAEPASQGQDDAMARRLWERSAALVGVEP